MDTTDTANQADGIDTSEDTDTIDTGAETEVQEQLDDNGDPIEDTSDIEEDDEVDLDEETKLKLPKSQAEKLRQAMLRQADYTRKTQELAEQRKAFEAERQAVTQADEQELSARGNLTLIENQHKSLNQEVIQKYGSWDAFHDQDPFNASKAEGQVRRLEAAYTQTNNYLSALRQQRATQEQQETAKRMEEGRTTLVKAIPEWSPAYSAKLFDDAQKTFGLTPDDLDGISDPRVIIVLDAAVRGRALMSGQKKAQNLQQQQKVVPAAKAVSGGNPVPPGKLDDRLSAEAWVKRRNEQLRKRA